YTLPLPDALPISTPADYTIIAERYRQRHPEVPVVPNLDRQILDRIERSGSSLDMADWHTCETTHCRAGWAIVLAGAAGRRPEAERGPSRARAAMYRASTGRAPLFLGSNSASLDDLRARTPSRPLVDAEEVDGTVRITVGDLELGVDPAEALTIANRIATAAGAAIARRRSK